MKHFLMIFAILLFLSSCSKGDSSVQSTSPGRNMVEIICFHGKQRCATCIAIEKNTNEVINTLFADELNNGSLVLRNVDISTPEGEEIADQYEVTWSSLYVNKWKDGKETRCNLTEFGFANARKNPDGFKKGLAEKIHQSLK